MSPKKRSRFVAYIRVSSQEQASEGLSLAAQRKRLEAWAVAEEVELVEVVADEGLSAGKPIRKRAGGRRAIELLESGEADGLVFVKLDRVFRSTADCVLTVDREFRKHGWELVSLNEKLDTTTAMGRFLIRTFASLAELEREQGGERTSEVLQSLKAEGVQLGRAALGWRHTDDLDEDGRRVIEKIPDEVRLVRRIKNLRTRGHSLHKIAAKLNESGAPTKRGGLWYACTVRNILLREDDAERRAARARADGKALNAFVADGLDDS